MSRRHFMRTDGGFGDPIVTEDTETQVVEEPIVTEDTETQVVEEPTEPEVTEEPTEEPVKSLSYIKGKVVDCKKLNVRPAPFTTAEPLCTIPVGAPVTIDLNKSVEEWYAVCTEAGVEGYCMQKYIVTE